VLSLNVSKSCTGVFMKVNLCFCGWLHTFANLLK
jgi:hypothetical protein